MGFKPLGLGSEVPALRGGPVMLATIFYRAGTHTKKINIRIEDEQNEKKRRKEALKEFRQKIGDKSVQIIKYEFKW